MLQYSENYNIKLSKAQKETLEKLKSKYRINPAIFIRQAIAEKLDREKLAINEVTKIKLPF